MQGGHSEEIECHDRFAMIGEKCLPALIRLPHLGPQASQIPGDRAFGDCKTELQQLAMDLRRSPAGILKPHLANEITDLIVDLIRQISQLAGVVYQKIRRCKGRQRAWHFILSLHNVIIDRQG